MEYIDFERLRTDLINYFGTAMYNISIAAMGNIQKIERASKEELIEIARENGFNLADYKI